MVVEMQEEEGQPLSSPSEGGEPAAAGALERPEEGALSADDAETRKYTLAGLEGEWTLQQLVEMELERDARLAGVRRSALPPAFWDARRRARNRERLQRNYARRKRKSEALREEEEARRAALAGPAHRAEYEAARAAEREAAKAAGIAAAAAQRERVAQAMRGGLHVVVDCSLSAAASDREVRSLCKQLELCAAANKRAARPVALRFASFAGAVRRFALEGMHADRWPAAEGREEPLAQLYPPRGQQQLVVLSPDAEQALGELEEGKVYVIGGLVDRTVQKGASMGLAAAAGAEARRLPIAETLGVGAVAKGKGVLNVNDVFAALLAVHGGRSWREALEAAIPKRFRQGGGGGGGGKRAGAGSAQQQAQQQQAQQPSGDHHQQQQQGQQQQQSADQREQAPQLAADAPAEQPAGEPGAGLAKPGSAAQDAPAA